MRMSWRVTTSLAAVVLATVPVLTITNGFPDGVQHPYVGIAVQNVPGGEIICSGADLSPTKMLTAAHCFDPDPANPVWVVYLSEPPFTGWLPGTFHPDPAWCATCGSGLQGSDRHDVGVITHVASNLGSFAALPPVGFVDTLPNRTPVDLVGYGVQGFTRGGGPPNGIFTAIRFVAPSLLMQTNKLASPEFITLTANPAQGKGGTCFGDSGGPDLLGGTDIVLAVDTFVTNRNCTGVTYSNRVDLSDIQTFINKF